MAMMLRAPARTARPRGRPRQKVLRPEQCPKGHVGRIWLDGKRIDTDRHATIRFRCVPDDGSPAHPFTWPHRMRWEVPRLNGAQAHCAACAAAYRPGYGPHIGFKFDFAYADAAAALILIGQGMSFRKAAA